jgi:pimeloyl-ACP methyl ester carboxylesterase
MKIIHAARGRLRITVALATAALAIEPGRVRPDGPAAAAKTGSASGSKPSIVLVHGAWADSSSWDAVVARLQRDGYTVYVPPNPLRGLSPDHRPARDRPPRLPRAAEGEGDRPALSGCSHRCRRCLHQAERVPQLHG